MILKCPASEYFQFLGLKGQLPCDIHMLNLRSVVTSSSKEAALLLHRKGFDCGFGAALLTCHLTSGQVNYTMCDGSLAIMRINLIKTTTNCCL